MFGLCGSFTYAATVDNKRTNTTEDTCLIKKKSRAKPAHKKKKKRSQNRSWQITQQELPWHYRHHHYFPSTTCLSVLLKRGVFLWYFYTGNSPFSFIWMSSDLQFELTDKVDPDCWRMFEALLHLGEDSPCHLYAPHPSVDRFFHLFSWLAWSKAHPHSSCSLSLLSPFAASGRLPADAAPLAAPCKWADKGKRKEREKKSKQYICIHMLYCC